ncbi:unnamed protein product, partial [Oikopleura dioica]
LEILARSPASSVSSLISSALLLTFLSCKHTRKLRKMKSKSSRTLNLKLRTDRQLSGARNFSSLLELLTNFSLLHQPLSCSMPSMTYARQFSTAPKLRSNQRQIQPRLSALARLRLLNQTRTTSLFSTSFILMLTATLSLNSSKIKSTD